MKYQELYDIWQNISAKFVRKEDTPQIYKISSENFSIINNAASNQEFVQGTLNSICTNLKNAANKSIIVQDGNKQITATIVNNTINKLTIYIPKDTGYDIYEFTYASSNWSVTKIEKTFAENNNVYTKSEADNKFQTVNEIANISITQNTASGANNVITITETNGTTTTLNVKNGNDGVSLNQTTLVNNLTDGGSTNVLSAEMGKVLNEKFGDCDKTLQPELTLSTSYVNNSGAIASSIHGGVVKFYKVSGGTISINITKTNNTATQILSFAESIDQITGLIPANSDKGNTNTYTTTLTDYTGKYLVVSSVSTSTDTLIEHLPNYIEEIKDATNSILNEFTYSKVYTEDDCIIPGYYVNCIDGKAYTGSNNVAISDFLPTENIKSLTLSISFSGTGVGMAFYNASKTFISGIKYSNQNNYPYIIPEEAKYFRYYTKDNNTIEIKLAASGIDGFRIKQNRLQDQINSLQNDTKEKHVLIIGNSFTEHPCSYLQSICNNLGVNNVSLQYIYTSSASLQHYATHLNDSYALKSGVNSGTLFGNGTLTEIITQPWDIIVFQQLSGDSADYSTYQPYILMLINKVHECCTNRNVKLYFNMTWPYPAQSEMWEGIRNANRKLQQDLRLTIIGSGTAVENIRSLTGNSYTYDNRHLSVGVGRYVAACALYTALIYPFTGISIYNDNSEIDISGITDGSQNNGESVTTANRIQCQKAAVYGVIYPWEVTNIADV